MNMLYKYSKIAVEAGKRIELSKEQVVEEANRSGRHRMPGETLKETQRSFLASNAE